jgi:hypothetical protein
MRSQNYKSKLAYLALVFLLTGSLMYSQANETKMVFSNEAISNLEMGIKSENDGLKKSSIYFAGKYEVIEVVEVLMDELDNADDTAMKYLISVALYKIGEADGMAKVEELSKMMKMLEQKD